MNEAVEIAASLIRRFEGFRARPYLCPAGVPTVGYGFTRYPDGHSVKLTDVPMARDSAEVHLLSFIERDYLPAVVRLCPTINTPERLGAITDFAYNLGLSALRSSTLRQSILGSRWDDVPAQLRRWTRGGGRVLAGLVARREAECALFE